MISNKFSPVAREAIWREHVNKELDQLVLRLDFTTNPHSLNLISEKPTKISGRRFRHSFNSSAPLPSDDQTSSFQSQSPQSQSPQSQSQSSSSAQALSSSFDSNQRVRGNQEDIVRTLRQAQLTPREKHPHALTANQEYGWYNTPDLKSAPGVAQWQRKELGRKSCPITNYVHAYLVNQGHSPFSSSSSAQQASKLTADTLYMNGNSSKRSRGKDRASA